MAAVALRSLASRKLRTALTAVAILLGVAMVSGAYIETDQIRTAFADITEESVAKIDVVVSPPESFSASLGTEPPTLDRSLTRRIASIPGVAAAEPSLATFGQLVVDGEPIETMGAPPLAFAAGSARFDPTEIVEGRRPSAPGEASILLDNATDNGIALGDRIGVATRHGEKPVRVVGFVTFGGGGSALGGATMILLDRGQFDRWFDMEGKANAINVIAEDGVEPALLSARIKSTLGPGVKVQTAAENADETSDQVNDQIGSFLTPALLALAGAAVLVGAFIIFNTFSITVAQRTREFALLRAVGATRGQILAGVGIEALALGVLASIVGLGTGIAFSKALNALFDAAGFGIPRSGLVLELRTVVIAFAVGVGATLVASLVPALRATRVTPVSAMTGSQAPPSRRQRRIRAAASIALVLVGSLVAAQGLFGSGPASGRLGAISAGAIAVFVGLAVSARYFIRPLAGLIGWPIERLAGATGRLARENTMRNPSRTAITSAALMVGLALVVFVAMFTAGLKTSLTGQIDRLISADLIVRGANFQAFPERTLGVVEGVPGVARAATVEFDQVEVNGEDSNATTDLLMGVDPEAIAATYDFDWVDGDDSLPSQLVPGDVLIEEQFAKAHDLSVGDSYRVLTPSGGTAELTAIGEYRDPTLLQGSIGSLETLHSVSQSRDPLTMLVSVADDANPDTVQAELKSALASFPSVEVETREEYQDTLSGQLDQIVYMLYALLAMSIVISLFGIANSLFLAIHERTGEIGVLRALGTTKGQIRGMVRWESVITASIGGLLGIVVGIVFGAVVIASLSDLGLHADIPVGQLAMFMLVAVVVGVLGAIAPARRAARMDVLRAIAQE